MSGPTWPCFSVSPKALETNVYPMSFGSRPATRIASSATRVAASRPVSAILPNRLDAAPTTHVSRIRVPRREQERRDL